MAIETKYKCDRCEHEQLTPEQMFEIKATYKLITGSYGAHHTKQKHWCRKCMEQNGIVSGLDHPQQQTPPQETPALEDVLREIIKEEIENHAN